MAAAALSKPPLPSESELQSFARAAARLLADQRMRAAGSRVVRRRAGSGIQHLDHRDYVHGDEVRHIDWRQTARRRRPIIRRFEAETVSDWTILLDASPSMTVAHAAKWHAALRAAAAMSYVLLQLGHGLGVLVFSDRVLAECTRARGQQHYASVVRTLRAVVPHEAGAGSDLGACASRLRGAASVFAISDFLGEGEMRRDLAALLQRCASLHALQVTDPAELEVPALGHVDLVDVETGVRISTYVDDRAIVDARDRRGAMTRTLRSFCTRTGIAFTDWNVGEPWQQTLIGHLARARSMC
jgi:uncharacterized protein (DUF58 family)